MKEYWFVLVLSLEEEISSISSYITTYKLTLSPTSRRQMEKRPSKESNHFSFWCCVCICPSLSSRFKAAQCMTAIHVPKCPPLQTPHKVQGGIPISSIPSTVITKDWQIWNCQKAFLFGSSNQLWQLLHQAKYTGFVAAWSRKTNRGPVQGSLLNKPAWLLPKLCPYPQFKIVRNSYFLYPSKHCMGRKSFLPKSFAPSKPRTSKLTWE